jgi:hypothetical protein
MMFVDADLVLHRRVHGAAELQFVEPTTSWESLD